MARAPKKIRTVGVILPTYWEKMGFSISEEPLPDSVLYDAIDKLVAESNDLSKRYNRHCIIEFAFYFVLIAGLLPGAKLKLFWAEAASISQYWGVLFFIAAYEAYVAAKIYVQKVAIDRHLAEIIRSRAGVYGDHINLRAETRFFTLLRKNTPDNGSHPANIFSPVCKKILDWVEEKFRLCATTFIATASLVLICFHVQSICPWLICVAEVFGQGVADAMYPPWLLIANGGLLIAGLAIHLWQMVYRFYYIKMIRDERELSPVDDK